MTKTSKINKITITNHNNLSTHNNKVITLKMISNINLTQMIKIKTMMINVLKFSKSSIKKITNKNLKHTKDIVN